MKKWKPTVFQKAKKKMITEILFTIEQYTHTHTHTTTIFEEKKKYREISDLNLISNI